MKSAIIKNYRWIIVTILFAGTVINYLDRQIIGLLKPILGVEFNWTETDFAKIMAAFSFAYAIGLLLSGVFYFRCWADIFWMFIKPVMVLPVVIM